MAGGHAGRHCVQDSDHGAFHSVSAFRNHLEPSCQIIRNPVHCGAKHRENRLGNAISSVRRALVLALTLALSAFSAPSARAQVFSADAVRAAFLHRFASYVEWPPELIDEGPFVIAVVGGEGVAKNLEELLPGITVQGRTAQVRRITRAAELDGVHIVYVSPEMMGRTRELRATALQRPILLVTEVSDGLDEGGVINFVESGKKVRFEVSLAAADRARLRIDSSLLSVAARVERRPQGWLPSAERLTVGRESGWRIPLAAIEWGRGH